MVLNMVEMVESVVSSILFGVVKAVKQESLLLLYNYIMAESQPTTGQQVAPRRKIGTITQMTELQEAQLDLHHHAAHCTNKPNLGGQSKSCHSLVPGQLLQII
jgi:hypothetical protein